MIGVASQWYFNALGSGLFDTAILCAVPKLIALAAEVPDSNSGRIVGKQEVEVPPGECCSPNFLFGRYPTRESKKEGCLPGLARSACEIRAHAYEYRADSVPDGSCDIQPLTVRVIRISNAH